MWGNRIRICTRLSGLRLSHRFHRFSTASEMFEVAIPALLRVRQGAESEHSWKNGVHLAEIGGLCELQGAHRPSQPLHEHRGPAFSK